MTKATEIITQTRLLPLIWAYAAQYLPDLKKADGGRCIGMAVTLAESIGKNELDFRQMDVDLLIKLEKDLLAGKTVFKDPDLDSFVSAIMKNHSNKSAGPVVVAGEFDDDAYIEACQWLEKPGETIVFGSNYEDSGRETHAIAVSLLSSSPRSYCLIDANGSAPIALGGSVKSSLVGITEDVKLVPKFVKDGLWLQKEMVTSVHFLSFDTVPRVPDVDRNKFYQKHISKSQEKIEKIALRVLTNLGAKDDEKSYYSASLTELMRIAKKGEYMQLTILIENKKKTMTRPDFMAFLNEKNSRGDTALTVAIRYNQLSCVQLLCAAGAECDLDSKAGEIKSPSQNISNFLSKLRIYKRYVQEFELFARFLNTRFEDAKFSQTIAKECRTRLLELALRIMDGLENSPHEVERMRKSVAACKFMHCSPKTSIKSFSLDTKPKYPTLPEEGELIASSTSEEYGTHHSTHLFYKMCDALVSDDKAKSDDLSEEIKKLYPRISIESYHMKMIKKLEYLNCYSSIPEVKAFGDELIWINFQDEKISLAEQKNIMKEALSLIGVIAWNKQISHQSKLEELARLKTMVEEFPVLNLSQNNSFFRSQKNETLLSTSKEFTDLYTEVCGKILNKMSGEEQLKLPGIFFRQVKWGFCDPKIDYAFKNTQVQCMRRKTMGP
jgi:hypothetical protein